MTNELYALLLSALKKKPKPPPVGSKAAEWEMYHRYLRMADNWTPLKENT